MNALNWLHAAVTLPASSRERALQQIALLEVE
jgi:hypothetical protein